MLKSAVLAALLCLSSIAFGADILDLDGNSRPLGTSNVNNILTVLTNGGHTVNTGTIAELPNNDVLLLAEPTVALTASEISLVQSFVSGGGFLFVITDSGCVGCTEINAVLSGIGSSISVSASGGSAAPIASTFFTTAPRDIAGQSISSTPASTVSGGSPLVGTLSAFEVIGSGLVVVIGERFDFDGANPTDGSSVNSQLFLNIADNAEGAAPPIEPDPPALPVPVNSAWGLAILFALLLMLGMVSARRIS
jgi:hypothetical protein